MWDRELFEALRFGDAASASALLYKLSTSEKFRPVPLPTRWLRISELGTVFGTLCRSLADERLVTDLPFIETMARALHSTIEVRWGWYPPATVSELDVPADLLRWLLAINPRTRDDYRLSPLIVHLQSLTLAYFRELYVTAIGPTKLLEPKRALRGLKEHWTAIEAVGLRQYSLACSSRELAWEVPVVPHSTMLTCRSFEDLETDLRHAKYSLCPEFKVVSATGISIAAESETHALTLTREANTGRLSLRRCAGGLIQYERHFQGVSTTVQSSAAAESDLWARVGSDDDSITARLGDRTSGWFLLKMHWRKRVEAYMRASDLTEGLWIMQN